GPIRCSADHLQNAASPSRSMSGTFAALRRLDRPLLNVRNSFCARSVAWDLRHITSLELATIQSNGQMFDFARTTTNIAQTPTSPAAFLTVTYRSICDSFFAGTMTCGT